jgi:hypothetical protein
MRNTEGQQEEKTQHGKCLGRDLVKGAKLRFIGVAGVHSKIIIGKAFKL